jgi:two-component system chemotaxis response regulator CheB
MGNDGATEIKKLRQMGYRTYGQNEESCTIYGMSKAAKEIDGINEELNIKQIIEKINNF